MIHGQGVNHFVTHGQDRFGTLSRWVIARQVVEEKVLDAVGGEVEKDGSATRNQADQNAEDDRARQQSPVDLFKFFEEDIKVGHSYRTLSLEGFASLQAVWQHFGKPSPDELIGRFLSLQLNFDFVDPLGVHHSDLLQETERNHGAAYVFGFHK